VSGNLVRINAFLQEINNMGKASEIKRSVQLAVQRELDDQVTPRRSSEPDNKRARHEPAQALRSPRPVSPAPAPMRPRGAGFKNLSALPCEDLDDVVLLTTAHLAPRDSVSWSKAHPKIQTALDQPSCFHVRSAQIEAEFAAAAQITGFSKERLISLDLKNPTRLLPLLRSYGDVLTALLEPEDLYRLLEGVIKNHSDDPSHEVPDDALEASLMAVVNHGLELRAEGFLQLSSSELLRMVQFEDAAQTVALVVQQGEKLMKVPSLGGVLFDVNDLVHITTTNLFGTSRAETLDVLLKHGPQVMQPPWNLDKHRLFNLAYQGMVPAVLPKIIEHGEAMFGPESQGGLGVTLDECVNTLLYLEYQAHEDVSALKAKSDAMLARIKNFAGA
jgi:hypothetical protein